MNRSASIVGAGLVGSLWAVFLAKRGYKVDVFERRGDMRKAGFIGGRSINLAMSDRGWKALRKAGIEEQIRQVAIPMHGRVMHSTTGELTYQPYGKEGQSIYSVSRGGLNLELMNIADQHESVNFHFDHKCEGLDMNTCELSFTDTTTGKQNTVDSPLVFGTDGAFSAVRSSLQRRPMFNYSQHYLKHGYKELTIPPNAAGEHQIEKNALHIWPRGQFMLIALPNQDGSFTCTLFLPFEGEESFLQLQSDKQILDFFNKYFADAVPLMPDLLNDFKNNPTPSLVTIRCNPWTYKNKVLLMGDASHAIVPFYGQGMNSGFEDCTLLDQMVDQYGEDWDEIMTNFNKTRIADADGIADLAIRNFIEMRDLVGDPKFLLRKKIAAHFSKKYPDQFLPLYSMVTFSHTPYAEALREGKAQDELFERILAIEDIESRWQSEEVEQIFSSWLNNKQSMA